VHVLETAGDEVDELSDEELTALALAADPDMELPDDAVPLSELLGEDRCSLLPSWYMPAPGGRVVRGRRWMRVVVVLVIAAFLALNAYGLCSTYGWISIA
jgi:hypothetical protein